MGVVIRSGHQVLGAGSVTIAEGDRVEVYTAGAVIDLDLVNRSRVASERLLAQRDDPRARMLPSESSNQEVFSPSGE